MNTKTFKQYVGGALYLLSLFTAWETSIVPARAQDDLTTTTGVVNSYTRNTLVVRSENDRFHLFVFDQDTAKPVTIAAGSRVRVTSSPGDEPGLRIARNVTVVDAAPRSQADRQRTQADAASPVVPPEVRRLETQIERDARRYQIGGRAGFALDPELLILGLQGQVGPFFKSNLYLRPNVEFGFGEVTALFALNLEAIYRLPMSRQNRWAPYFGLGPGFNFLHQNFERSAGQGTGSRIDFGDFHSDTGLNILGGVRYRSGMFMELKTSVYSNPSPTLRLVIGYDF